MGQAEEIARAVTFLASDDASHLAGIEFFVDGVAAQFEWVKQISRTLRMDSHEITANEVVDNKMSESRSSGLDSRMRLRFEAGKTRGSAELGCLVKVLVFRLRSSRC
jgi:hypothetical protein